MGLLSCGIIVICLVAVPTLASPGPWRDIDAAYMHQNRYLYLYSGDKVLRMDGKQQTNLYDKNGSAIPDSFKVQAAFMTLASQSKCIFYGPDNGLFYHFYEGTSPLKKLRYGKNRAFLRNGGPDAAARRAGKVYVFKGCMMAERKKWHSWGTPEDASATLGIPCNVDAAWQETDGAMVILKGQQFWRWELDGTITGAQAFSDHYVIKQWEH